MSVNVLDQNGNLKKIAHGFSESKFNTFRSDVISNIEMTDTASKDYAVGDFLIMANGQLVKVINAISEDSVITSNDVQAITVEEMIAAKADSADIPDVSKYEKTFTGTQAEWNQLTTTQKTAYDIANITDDLGTEADIVDAISDGDMRAVTSNAVHDALESKISTSETVGLVKNDGTIDTKNYAEKVTSAVTDNFASLDANGNPADSGITTDQTTTPATGNPISIANLKSAQIAKNPIITFEPIQAGSGTPSPSNVRAISGYDKIEVLSCGVNVWDEVWELGELNAQGQNASSTTKIRSKNYIPVVGGSTYYLKLSSASAQVYICFYDVNKTFISSNSPYQGTFTVPLMARYCRFNCPATYGTTYNNDMGINYPATQTSYVASNKTASISESLGQTVYWGEYDVRTGKFTVSHKIVDLSDLSWNYASRNQRFYAMATGIKRILVASEMLNGACSIYSVTSLEYFVSNDFCLAKDNGNDDYIMIKDSRYTDATAFASAVTGQKLVYELATPFTIQLTPHEIALSQGYNYISTNGTSISLAYHNGEVATHADVEQLGETVNELPYGLLKSKTFTLTTNSNGRVTFGTISDMIPIKAYNNKGFYTEIRCANDDHDYYYGVSFYDSGSNVESGNQGIYTVYGLPIK